MLYVISCTVVYARSLFTNKRLGFCYNIVFTVLAHGMGRIYCFIFKSIITCTEDKTAVLALSPFTCQVHTSPSREGSSITAVPLTTNRL